MFRKGRYTPVSDERVIACEHTVEECWALLARWCDETKNGEAHAHDGMVVKPFGDLGFRAHFQYDSSASTSHYYYKNYFLRIWFTRREDGGCDIHYQRVLDTLTGTMMRPFGILLIVAAIFWLIMMRNTTLAWVYVLAMFMIWLGAMLILNKVEKREQGETIGDLLEQAVAHADWTEE